VTIAVAELQAFGERALELAGARPDDARFLFGQFLDKALQGDSARGVAHLPPMVRAARAGLLDLDPSIELRYETPSAALIDGGERAAGDLVCRAGMRLAIDRALTTGVAIVGARAGAGLLGAHVTAAVERGLIGVIITQTKAMVAPLGGSEALLGNGPLAIGVPIEGELPLILDMSLTETSASGVLLAAAQGLSIPPGLLLDEDGNPSTDPSDFVALARDDDLGPGAIERHIGTRGTLTALGNSHKGYALLFAVCALASVLTGTSPPWEILAGTDAGVRGSVMLAINPAALGQQDLPARMASFVGRVTGSTRRADATDILYPGQRSAKLRELARSRGIVTVPSPHASALIALAHELGIAPPSFT
jgi:LDH2 family malate/lactate/ureidoglycolate dehydrogenase